MRFADLLAAPAPASSANARKHLPVLLAASAAVVVLAALARTSGFAGQGLRVAGALLLTAGLAFAALKRLARSQAGRPAPLKLVTKTPLSNRTALALVEMGGERYLLAYGDGFAQLVATRPVPSQDEGGTP